jgi:pilus assembly protein FimV
MGILDDAIREHLDLKRKHGAHDADLREIEDEAFGSTDRPDPFAANELFNEVSSTGAAEGGPPAAPSDQSMQEPSGLSEPDIGGEEPTRLVEPEAPSPGAPEAPRSPEPEALRPSQPEPAPEESLEPIDPLEGSAPLPGQVELPGQDEIPGQERLDDPLEGYQRSTESEPEPDLAPEPDAEPEPEAPFGSESLEDLIAEEEPFPEDTTAPPSALPPEDPVEPPPAPDRERALEAQEPEPEAPSEPESSVPEPPPPPPDTGPEPPGRARGRVDVPTQEHPAPGDTGGLPPLPPEEAEFTPAPLEPLEPLDEAPSREEPLPEPEPLEEEPADRGGGPALYDFETDEEPLSTSPAPAGDDFEALGPAEEEGSYVDDDEELFADESTSERELPPDEPGTAVRPALEDQEVYEGGAPDPEETYEEEEDEGEEGLWFEKGPPQDFDFDDK